MPIWFAYEGGKVYVATGRDTLKVRRLQANPRVSLTFHRRKGAILEGTGHICAEEALVQRIAPILNRKYGGAWGSDAWFARRLLGEDIVLLEITPLS